MPHSLLTLPFVMLFIQNFLFFTSLNSLNILPAYLSTQGASKVYTGLYMNISTLALVLFIFLFTKIVERLGKKRFLLIGFSFAIFANLMQFFFAHNLLLLLIFRIIGSFSYAAGFTINSAQIFEIIPKEKRTGGFALYGISGILSNPVGSLIGEYFLHHSRAEYLFLVSACFVLVAALFAFMTHYPEHHERMPSKTMKHILQYKGIIILISLAFIFGGAWSILATFLPQITAERIQQANLSAYFIAFSIITILSRIFFSGFIDKLSKKALIIFAFSVITFGLSLVPGLHKYWQLFLIGGFYGLGHSILYPVLSTLFVNTGRESEKYMLNNTYTAFNTLGTLFFSTLLGLLGDLKGTPIIFISMSIISLGALCITIFKLPGKEKPVYNRPA